MMFVIEITFVTIAKCSQCVRRQCLGIFEVFVQKPHRTIIDNIKVAVVVDIEKDRNIAIVSDWYSYRFGTRPLIQWLTLDDHHITIVEEITIGIAIVVEVCKTAHTVRMVVLVVGLPLLKQQVTSRYLQAHSRLVKSNLAVSRIVVNVHATIPVEIVISIHVSSEDIIVFVFQF